LEPIHSRAALNRPRSYILIPLDDTGRSWKKDDPFVFTIAVFGRANDYLPHLVYAVREMGKAGLGQKAPDQGRFRMDTVRERESVIYEGTTLRTPTQLPELTLGSPLETSVKEITLTCLTPLGLKYDKQLQDGLPFHLSRPDLSFYRPGGYRRLFPGGRWQKDHDLLPDPGSPALRKAAGPNLLYPGLSRV
jgi:hypothetical protein